MKSILLNGERRNLTETGKSVLSAIIASCLKSSLLGASFSAEL
jgi:hypothetical protein